MPARQFRFRPRFRGLVGSATAMGASLLVAAAAIGGPPILWGTGTIGVLLGGLYLVSPTWRLIVTVDDDGLEVGTAKARRFRVAWADVVQVIASPATRTCFVDGGDPGKSLLVPGDGAPAPYDIEDRAALYDAIRAHVPADRVIEVELLEQYRRAAGTAT
jgi:hypothetical protein